MYMYIHKIKLNILFITFCKIVPARHSQAVDAYSKKKKIIFILARRFIKTRTLNYYILNSIKIS